MSSSEPQILRFLPILVEISNQTRLERSPPLYKQHTMALKFNFDIAPGLAQTFTVEISLGNEEACNEMETLNIHLQDFSEFQRRIVVSNRRVASQDNEAGAEDMVDVEPKKDSIMNLKDPLYNDVDHFNRSQGKSRLPQGCGANTLADLLLKLHLTSPGTEDASNKGIAAQQPVTQIAHPNDMLSVWEPSPVTREAPHHSAKSISLSCCGAQPTGHSRGRSAQKFRPFVGTARCSPSTECEESRVRQRMKCFTGLRLVLPKREGGVANRTATMDTGSSRNLITRKLLDLLGHEIDDEGTGIALDLVGGMEVETQGTVQLEFWLQCNHTLRQEEFQVVQSLPGHQILLSAALTEELGHLQRLRCRCDGSSL